VKSIELWRTFPIKGRKAAVAAGTVGLERAAIPALLIEADVVAGFANAEDARKTPRSSGEQLREINHTEATMAYDCGVHTRVPDKIDSSDGGTAGRSGSVH
jgi:hypothetical protein